MSRLFIVISLLLLTLSNWGQTEEKVMLNKGIEAYKKGNFNLALEEFNNGYKTNGEYKKALFNAGDAALFNDSITIAKDLFSEYISVADSKTEKSKGYYNLGNVQYKEYENLTKNPEKSQEAVKALKESIKSYKNALRNNPKDNDARYNLKLAMSKLPPPNENKDQQNKEDKQNQDQQNKDKKEDKKDEKDENKDGQDKNGENKKDGDKGDENKEGDKGEEKGDKQKDGEKGDEQKDGKEDQQKGGDKGDEEKDGEQKGNQGEESKEKGEEEMKGRISRNEATKDLDALNNDQQNTVMKVNRKKGDHKQQNSSSKDW